VNGVLKGPEEATEELLAFVLGKEEMSHERKRDEQQVCLRPALKYCVYKLLFVW
jgi:hypothetical protein